MNQKRVALVQMPFWDTDSPPLALAMVSSVLKRKQVEIKCFDFNKTLAEERTRRLIKDKTLFSEGVLKLLFPEYYPPFNERQKNLVLKLDKFLDSCFDELMTFKPDIIAFSVCTYIVQSFCLLFAKKIKKSHPEIKIVFGGLIYARGLNNDLPLKTGFVDEIVHRCEEDKFFEKFEDKKDCNFDPDIVYFDLFDLKKYPPILPMLWTEGCNMGCKFCIHHSIGGPHKTFDINKIIKQIKFYIKEYNIHTFRLSDSNVNQNPKFLSDICDRIIEENLNISWAASFYIHPGIKADLLKKMAKSGCERVLIGMESGSQKILNELNKKFTVEMAEDTIKKLHDCGIKTSIYIIIGSPSETHRDYWETIKVLFDLAESIDGISHILPLSYQKGSQFYLEMMKNNPIEVNLPSDLEEYENYFPYVFSPKPSSDKSTINDWRYLKGVTLNIFNENFRMRLSNSAASGLFSSNFKIKNSPLIIDKTYYDGNKFIKLNSNKDIKEAGDYYFRIPQDVGELDNTIRTEKKIGVILDINYEYYLDKKEYLVNYLNRLTTKIKLKLCRPIPPCLISDELSTKENLTKECKDCIAYLYLNKEEKIVNCRKKSWDYYIKNNNKINKICEPCLYRKNGQCKRCCIKYLANNPL